MRNELRRPAPISVLRELSRAQSTGELVCALGASEVHIYLQRGRVAWGTDTEHPFAFGRRIMEICGIDREHFTALVADCRRQKRALGECLVQRGFATREQTRESLRYQAALAVRALEGSRGGDCAFFERSGFASYDPNLTFALDDLLEAELPCARGVTRRVRTAAPPSPASGPARRAFQDVTGCEWAERWCGDALVEQLARSGSEPMTPRALLRQVQEDAVDFVAVRSGAGAILGATLERTESIWCGVRDDAPFGAAYAFFAELCGLERRSQTSRPLGGANAEIVEDHGTTFGATALALMERVVDVHGACHLIGAEVSSLAARKGSEGDVIPARLAQFSEHVFAPEVLVPGAGASGGSTGYGLRTAVLGEVDLWTYGIELSAITGESLWLVTSRRVAQGFGWACLAAMVRELGAL